MRYSSASLFLLFPAIACFGCRSFTGYPHGMDLTKRDETPACYSNDSVTQCRMRAEEQQCISDFDAATEDAIEYCHEQLAPQRKICRNELVDCRIRVVDLEFVDFERSLNQESNAFNFSGDVTVESLTGAAALVTGTSAKILSALAGVVTGAKSSIDKNVYYTKTLPALMLTMEATRSKKLTDIRTKERDEIDDYSLDAALSDVDSYFSAGSIPAALVEISTTAGNSKAKSEQERSSITPADHQQSQDPGESKPKNNGSPEAVAAQSNKEVKEKQQAPAAAANANPPRQEERKQETPPRVSVRLGAGPVSTLPGLPAITVDKIDLKVQSARIHFGRSGKRVTLGETFTENAGDSFYAIKLIQISTDSCVFSISKLMISTQT